MMTTTNTVFAKFAVAFVAIAMMFSFVAPASAQSSSDMSLEELIALVATLQGQLTGDVVASSAAICPYTWTRSLNMGATGDDVMKLQQFLNSMPETMVAASGAGSAGMETSYYGPATGAAVAKFQMKYRSEILSPLGLVNPTTFFGNSTRAQANDLCVATMDNGGDDMDGGDDDDNDDGGSQTLSGEASLDNMEIDSASDDDIEEGEEDAEVAEVTIEFTDGDAEISRLDVKFEQTGAAAEDAFESISIWVDGDKVAEQDADDEDEYQNDEMTMRFSGLDIFAEEDEEVEIVIAVTTQNNLDADELGSWDVSVESMRFFDADGVATTETSGNDFGVTESFTIEEAGAEDELKAKTSSNDPDASTLQVEDDSKSDWYSVFVFDLDTDDSVNDIEINELVLNVATTVAQYADIVDDAELVIDGVTIDDVSVDSTGAEAVLTFDVDGDVVIDAGDRVEAELMLRFKSLAPGDEGATVQGSVSLSDATVDAEGADDLTDAAPDQLSGAATGDAHTLRTTGIDTVMSDSDATVTVNDGDNNDYATFEIEVDVTAFEQDVFISVDDTVSVDWDLVNSAGADLGEPTASTSVVLSSSADENAGYFEVNEGETETVTLTVTYSPGTAASISARLLLNSITFDDDAASEDQTQTTLPASDYRTEVKTIVN